MNTIVRPIMPDEQEKRKGLFGTEAEQPETSFPIEVGGFDSEDAKADFRWADDGGQNLD